MPVVFRWNGHRFHFYSDEGDPHEPVHIHVAKAGADAKPVLSLSKDSGCFQRSNSLTIGAPTRARSSACKMWWKSGAPS